LDKLNFIEAISLGLVASLAGRLLEATARSGECVSLGTPKEYFRNNSIAVISPLQATVCKGDSVLAFGNDTTRWGCVLEIQVDDLTVESADAGTEAGLRLDFALQKGVGVHLWPSPISELIPPAAGMFGIRGPLRES
jgi:hypothetical protein